MTVPSACGTFSACHITLLMLQEVAWNYGIGGKYKKNGGKSKQQKNVSGYIGWWHKPLLPKVHHWCCGTLSPLLLEHGIMALVEKKWGNENHLCSKRKTKTQLMCVVDCKEKRKKNQQSTYICGMAARCSNNNKKTINLYGAETKEWLQNKNNFPSTSMHDTTKGENKTTCMARSTTVQVPGRHHQ